MSRADDDPLGITQPRPLPPGQRRAGVLRPIHYGRVPRIALDRWRFTVEGETADGGMTQFSWETLNELGHTEVTVDHHCVSRRTVQDVTWGGIPCRALIDAAPPAASAVHVVAAAAYGYHANVTVDDLLSPRALLATHLDGEPLPPEHGWPLRLILPHLYGWKGPKWLLSLEYSTAPRRGFWEQQGYHFTGDVWREERYSHQE
ncbi:molybdopterin-dependent oxidoreductase [Agilicoccus flavus]|uniref:molybdopterin-dependent oxidoreductase n=1 Tax=Agilicoccus flavus TaxID=2775968 RepID=UPI001CF6265D|nr:molybdopterin-dependent oxidoreductase [Agilicoccus flavus]